MNVVVNAGTNIVPMLGYRRLATSIPSVADETDGYECAGRVAVAKYASPSSRRRILEAGGRVLDEGCRNWYTVARGCSVSDFADSDAARLESPHWSVLYVEALVEDDI